MISNSMGEGKGPDLFAWAAGRDRHSCGACCHHTGPIINAGIRFCAAFMVWRRETDALDCPAWSAA